MKTSSALRAVIALVVVVSVTISVAAPPTRAQPSGEPGDPARGKQLYYEHGCYGCHGYNGETGVRRLVGTGSPIVENVDAFMAFLRLRAGFAPLFPSTSMPNYAQSTLSDEEAGDIFAYIQTFELDAPDVDDVPALRAIVESASER